ncbi:methionyl-tRNA formyltransferase [Halosimplex sp. TS25]|uniref:methionyl-tRNA formyltransferase n=1 Tax=Halosimplex rarum TaxID=3396619 RepID=UPI0039EA57E3
MRTVVVGNRKLARHVLRQALAGDWDVVGVVVPEGRLAKSQANFVPFDALVAGTDCVLHETSDINSSGTVEWLRDRDPDVCLCGGWSQIIDESVLNVPSEGFLGFHSSRLPEGRGGAPVNWALIDGSDEVWISLFYYDTEVDAGDVVAQGSVPVEPRDDVATVFDALAVEACRLLSGVYPKLAADAVRADPQSLADATYRPRRQPQDGIIDWSRGPTAQYDWVRAQTDPYPGAYTFDDGTRLTVWESTPIEGSTPDMAPGTVVDIVDGAGLDVATGDGVLRLVQVQPGRSPPRWGDQYAREMNLSEGDAFGREQAPAAWLYTGIRGPKRPTAFQTNLMPGKTGAVDVVAFSGSSHDLDVSVSLDDRVLFRRSVTVAPEYRRRVEYASSEPETRTLTVAFDRDGERVDTRHLKLFVGE